MKKLICLFFALLIISCSQSNEDKIRSAFKEHVKTSFDDPSKFEEIVSIDSLDTISTIEIKKQYSDIMELRKQKYAMCDSFTTLIFKYTKDESIRPQLRKMDEFRALYYKTIELQKYLVETMYKGLSLPAAEEDWKEILAHKDTVMYSQRISYRIKTNDGLKINSCYVYSDTLYNKIVFKDTRMKAYEVSDIFREIDDLDEKYGILFNIYEKIIEVDSQILLMLRSNFDNRY